MPQLSTIQREDTLNLMELAAEVDRRQRTRIDIIADTRKVGFHSTDEGASYLTVDGQEEITPWHTTPEFAPSIQGFKVNDHAHGQIANRLTIPKTYYDRLRKTAPGLLDDNVRHWLDAEPKTGLIRTLDGQVRAMLSDRFRRLDNYDLLGAVLPAFKTVDGLEFHIASLTDKKMYLRAILPGLQADITGKGDIVQAGVEIRNSEVGAGTLTVSPYLWRLVCLNGMVSNSLISARHTGRKIDESEENIGIYRDETLRADDTAFFMKVTDLVTAALTEVQFEKIVAQLRSTATGEKIKDPIAATKVLGTRLDLLEGEQTSILTHLIEGGDLSQWGAVNAITATAKEAAGFDRVAELEEIGGRLASLPANEWQRVAVAA